MQNRMIQKQLHELLAGRPVLVVEPMLNYKTSIKQFLTNLKVKNLKVVSSIADAKREIFVGQFGLFIVEWSLSDVNGLKFCKDLRDDPRYRHTPFLLMSTENLRKDIMLASEGAVDGYLLKPFSYEEFCSQIAHLMKRHKSMDPYASLFEQSESLAAAGDDVGAAVILRNILAMRSDSAKALCELARIDCRSGRTTEALAKLQEAVTANTNFIESYRLMLQIYDQLGNKEGMIEVASVLHARSSDNPRYTLALAKAYLGLGSLSAAEKFFKLTIRLSPLLADGYKGLGGVFLGKRDYEQAQKYFKRALDLDAGDVSTLNSLGTTYVRMGQFQTGIEKYLLALRLDTQDFRVHFNLGYAYEKQGNLKKAGLCYHQSLALKADYDKARRALERVAGRTDQKIAPDYLDDGIDFEAELHSGSSSLTKASQLATG